MSIARGWEGPDELRRQIDELRESNRRLRRGWKDADAEARELRAELARAQETISMRNRMIDGLREWMRDHCAALSPAPEPQGDERCPQGLENCPPPGFRCVSCHGLPARLGSQLPAELPRICCRACEPEQLKAAGLHPLLNRTFVVCPQCHNKRCPKAENHRNRCTGSNESGQVAEPEQTGDWHCPNCGYIADQRVTFEETCDTCHEPVDWCAVEHAQGGQERPTPAAQESGDA